MLLQTPPTPHMQVPMPAWIAARNLVFAIMYVSFQNPQKKARAACVKQAGMPAFMFDR
jgi:hypothetical protein